MAGTRYGILAGYDGSPCAEQALRWAAREAAARGVVLTVCHSWAPVYPVGPSAGAVFELAKRIGAEILARGVRHARDLVGSSVHVRPALAAEGAAVALCGRSGDAEMTVVGSRGHGGLAGILLGSVSKQVAAHAHGRVVIVRGDWQAVGTYVPGAIVVGCDGSAESAAAVEFAFEEAALRDAPLVAVCAAADAAAGIGGARQVEDDFEQILSRCEKRDPDVVVHRRVTAGPARSALLATASDVQSELLVLGGRDRGGGRGRMLGSASHAALHHAPCPVAVVHRR